MRIDIKERCPHELIPEWCAICKRVPREDFEMSQRERDVAFVENLLKWI